MSNNMNAKTETRNTKKLDSRRAFELDLELEEYVSRLESEWSERGPAEFTKFLPSTDHGQFDAVAMMYKYRLINLYKAYRHF